MNTISNTYALTTEKNKWHNQAKKEKKKSIGEIEI